MAAQPPARTDSKASSRGSLSWPASACPATDHRARSLATSRAAGLPDRSHRETPSLPPRGGRASRPSSADEVSECRARSWCGGCCVRPRQRRRRRPSFEARSGVESQVCGRRSVSLSSSSRPDRTAALAVGTSRAQETAAATTRWRRVAPGGSGRALSSLGTGARHGGYRRESWCQHYSDASEAASTAANSSDLA